MDSDLFGNEMEILKNKTKVRFLITWGRPKKKSRSIQRTRVTRNSRKPNTYFETAFLYKNSRY
jgi:hypothetical protein